MWGGFGAALGGLGQQQVERLVSAREQAELFNIASGRRAPPPPSLEITIIPTIEAGDKIRDVLQYETNEWLKDIK